MDSRNTPIVLCSLSGDEHETKIARNGRPYFNCELWINRLFGNSQVSLAIFGNNGGPGSAPRPRRGRANPDPIEGPIAEGGPPVSRGTGPFKTRGAAVPGGAPRWSGLGGEGGWGDPRGG